MTTKRPAFILAGIVSASLLAACSSDKSSPGSGSSNDGGGTGGSTAKTDSGPPPADCKHIDYSSYASADPVSFKDDVLPLFGFSCTVSGCHRPDQHEAGLNLGYRCAPDTTSKWKCSFPAPPDPNPASDLSKPHPLDDKIISDVYDSLMAPSSTVTDGSVKRVAPNDPGNSFLILKLADQENSKGYTCMNQDPTHEDNPGPCGLSMPQGGATLYCEGTDRKKFDAIAAWIAQGAQKN